MLDALRKTYTNIDIRILIGRENATAEWQCIFLKIRLTDESEAKIELIHNEKKSRLTPNKDRNFRLITTHEPMSHLDTLLSEIDQGKMKIGEESVLLYKERSTEANELSIQEYGSDYEVETSLVH